MSSPTRQGKDRDSVPQGWIAGTLYRSACILPQRIIARLKIMCDLDISERRKPQDGKIKFKKFGPLDIELRVADIAGAGGVEDCVMRILAAGEPIPLDKMGFSRAISQVAGCGEQAVRPVLRLRADVPGRRPRCTRCSSISILRHQDLDGRGSGRNHPEGLRQVQINKKAGLDFAVIMKGVPARRPGHHHGREMRDKETTSIGIEAFADRPLGVRNPAHQQRDRNPSSGCSTWAWTRSTLPSPARHPGATPREAPMRKCKQAYNPAPDEIKLLLQEYCQELLNTTPFKKDAKSAYESVYKDLVKNYGNEKGQLTCIGRSAAMRAAARVTRAAWACTNSSSAPMR